MKLKVCRGAGLFLITALLVGLLSAPQLYAQKKDTIDEEYTRLIREATTLPEFLTPLVDHLPRAKGVPTPKDVLGYIVGAPDHLTYYDDIVGYLQALAKASNNVELQPIGKTSEGREMYIVVIADSKTLRNIKKYKEITAALSDPRKTSEAQAKILSAQGKPMYWLTCNIHSAETGSAEMSMELAYRLAVSNDPYIKTIRDNIIVLITPSLEPDGHQRHTDWYYRHNFEVKEYEKMTRVPYWGKYTSHDNNRDAIGLSQPETRNVIKTFFEWHPTILTDHHESVPYLYIMPGGGPYGEYYDPILTNEWHLIAFWEVTELTKWDMPGVWTEGTWWDGWTPNYMFSIANNHNAIGRFYETFGNAIGSTMERKLERGGRFSALKKETYKPLPPYEKVLWSMRNNVNYQQSAAISAMHLLASKKETFLYNFWKKGKNSLGRGKKESPYGWVIPSGQKDMPQVVELVNLLMLQGIEVYKTTQELKLKEGSYPPGSYVVRMDQPYRDFIQTLLGVQHYPADSPTFPYDDVAWTLGFLRDVEVVSTEDKSVQSCPYLTLLTSAEKYGGSFAVAEGSRYYIIPNRSINNLITALFLLKGCQVEIAEEPFKVGEWECDAGSLILTPTGSQAGLLSTLETLSRDLGLKVYGAAEKPSVKTHQGDLPRIAMLTTWTSTQDTGWVRFAFDQFRIPYTLISKDRVRKGGLKADFDVIVFPSQGGWSRSQRIVSGIDPSRGPLAYTRTEKFKNIGSIDSSEDITGGMGLQGVVNLERFVHEGGTLITLGSASSVPIEFAMTRGINLSRPQGLFVPGSILRTEIVQQNHPIAYGYDKELMVQRQNLPVIGLAEELEKFIILKYADSDDICASGNIKGEKNIRGKAALLALPVGEGCVVIFNYNPIYRSQTQGQYQLVFNAILNYNDFPRYEK